MRVAARRVSLSSRRQITPLHKVRVTERQAAGRTFDPCSVTQRDHHKGHFNRPPSHLTSYSKNLQWAKFPGV